MSDESAAFHGLATNRALPIEERFGCALQALELYEAEVDAMRPVVEAARALVGDWRAHRATHGGGLIAAVDALGGAQPCVCNPTHRPDDPICQYRGAS